MHTDTVSVFYGNKCPCQSRSRNMNTIDHASSCLHITGLFLSMGSKSAEQNSYSYDMPFHMKHALNLAAISFHLSQAG